MSRSRHCSRPFGERKIPDRKLPVIALQFSGNFPSSCPQAFLNGSAGAPPKMPAKAKQLALAPLLQNFCEIPKSQLRQWIS